MTKPVGFYKEGGKTKPITKRKSGNSKMSKSSSSIGDINDDAKKKKIHKFIIPRPTQKQSLERTIRDFDNIISDLISSSPKPKNFKSKLKDLQNKRASVIRLYEQQFS